jgi:hypothetical protein
MSMPGISRTMREEGAAEDLEAAGFFEGADEDVRGPAFAGDAACVH